MEDIALASLPRDVDSDADSDAVSDVESHAVVSKGYICIAPAFSKHFLDDCKHCRNKKVYVADYYAAAHLRRAHFHPPKPGRKGKDDEKCIAIGGSDHPAMAWLKLHWIKEMEVPNNTSTNNNPPSMAKAEGMTIGAASESDLGEVLFRGPHIFDAAPGVASPKFMTPAIGNRDERASDTSQLQSISRPTTPIKPTVHQVGDVGHTDIASATTVSGPRSVEDEEEKSKKQVSDDAQSQQTSEEIQAQPQLQGQVLQQAPQTQDAPLSPYWGFLFSDDSDSDEDENLFEREVYKREVE